MIKAGFVELVEGSCGSETDFWIEKNHEKSIRERRVLKREQCQQRKSTSALIPKWGQWASDAPLGDASDLSGPTDKDEQYDCM